MSTSATFSLAVVLSAMNRTGGAFGAVEQAAGKLKGAFARTSAAANELFTVGNTMSVGFAGWLLKQGMAAEDTAMNMQTLLNGNKAAADELVSQTKAVFAATKVGSSAALENAQSLLAFGLAKEKVVPVMQQLGDLALGNATKFNQLADNYGKMVSAQHVSIIDLRQFSLAGAPVIEELQKITGKAGAEFDKMVSDGDISVAMVEEAFARMTGEGGRFSNAMANAGKTTSGKLNVELAKLSDSTTKLATSLLPVVNQLISFAAPIAGLFSSAVSEYPKITSGIAGISVGIAGAIVAFKASKLAIVAVGDAFRFISKPLYNVYRITKLLNAAQAAGNMRAWYTTLEKGGFAARALAGYMRLAKIEQLGFNAATLLNPYIGGAVAFAAIAGTIGYYIYQKNKATVAEQLNIDATKRAVEVAAEERARLKERIDNIARNEEGSVGFKKALQSLKEQYPDYLSKLDVEKTRLQDLPGIYDKVAKGIDAVAKAQAMADLRKQYYADWAQEMGKKQALEIEGDNWADKARKSGFNSSVTNGLFGYFSNQYKIGEASDNMSVSEQKIAGINKMLDDQRFAAVGNNDFIKIQQTINLDGKPIAQNSETHKRIDNRGNYE